jgi:signal peptidase I
MVPNRSVSVRPPGSLRLRRITMGVLGGITLASLVVGLPVLIRTFVIELFRVPAGSMLPTLRVNDLFIVKKYAYGRGSSPRRGDVIVFRFPPDPSRDFVKRVVAIAGDSISVCGGQVQLNGRPLPRELLPDACAYAPEDDGEQRLPCSFYRERSGDAAYVTMSTWRSAGPSGPAEPAGPCTPAQTVPSGMLFVMGDNRDNSYDSRFWGLVPTENVRGQVWRIWLSAHPTTARERWLQPIR